MKKIVLVVVIVVILVLLLGGILYFIDMDKIKNNEPVIFSTWGKDYTAPVQRNDWNIEKEYAQLVRIKGNLYKNTGIEVNELRCGVMDGIITETVENTQIPTKDNQSNFGINYEYQLFVENSYDIVINDRWIRFALVYENGQYPNDSAVVEGVIKKVYEDSIIVDVESVGLTSMSTRNILNTDFRVEDKVEIHYNGMVMESYPAQFGNVYDIKVTNK